MPPCNRCRTALRSLRAPSRRRQAPPQPAKANANTTDMITFHIAGSTVQTITLGSDLAPIDGPVVIDGYTQPGASPNTLANGDNATILVELDANGKNGLRVNTGGGSTL